MIPFVLCLVCTKRVKYYSPILGYGEACKNIMDHHRFGLKVNWITSLKCSFISLRGILRVVVERFKNVKSLGDKTINQLSEEEIYWTSNSELNSVAIIVKYLSGNMVSRWTDFLNSDGEKVYRNRDQEFIDEIPSKAELNNVWEKGWKVLIDTLTSLNEQDLLKTIFIRGESHLVLDAIERQMAHYAYHVGQIVYIAKQLKDQNWESLSIPKGKSEEFLKEMLERDKGTGTVSQNGIGEKQQNQTLRKKSINSEK